MSPIRSKDNRNTEDQENYLQASVDALRRRLKEAERLLKRIVEKQPNMPAPPYKEIEAFLRESK